MTILRPTSPAAIVATRTSSLAGVEIDDPAEPHRSLVQDALVSAWPVDLQRLIILGMSVPGHRKSTLQLARTAAAFVREGRKQAWIGGKLNLSQARVSQLLALLPDFERPTYGRGRPRSR